VRACTCPWLCIAADPVAIDDIDLAEIEPTGGFRAHLPVWKADSARDVACGVCVARAGGSPPQVFDLIGLPPLQEAEVCERTGHKNGQPTHPERNVQAADLYPPPEIDPQEMRYRHDEKQHGGDRHVGFSIQPACLFRFLPHHDDSSTAPSCSMARSLLAWPGAERSLRPLPRPLSFRFEQVGRFGPGCLGSASRCLVSRFSEAMRC
jgi:hypothetical protein